MCAAIVGLSERETVLSEIEAVIFLNEEAGVNNESLAVVRAVSSTTPHLSCGYRRDGKRAPSTGTSTDSKIKEDEIVEAETVQLKWGPVGIDIIDVMWSTAMSYWPKLLTLPP